MNYYKDFTPMIAEAIRLNDHAVLDLMLTTILPSIDPRNKEDVTDIVNDSAFKNSSDGIDAVIMKHFPMDEKTSASYILSRIVDSSLSRKNLGKAIENLGNHYGLSMMNALYAGDMDIANKINGHYSGRKIEITSSSPPRAKAIIDGIHRYSSFGIKTPTVSRKDLLAMVEMASNLGITSPLIRNYDGTDEPCFFDEYIFDTNHLQSMKPMTVTPCEDLPIINANSVLRPELLLAFDQARKNSSALGRIYSRIPVLIKESQIGNYETVRAFRKCHKVLQKIYGEKSAYNIADRDVGLSIIDISELSSQIKKANKGNPDGVKSSVYEHAFTVFADDSIDRNRLIEKEYNDEILRDELVIGLLAPEIYKTGFNDDGYILCVIDFDELASLNISQPDELSLERAQKSAYEFFCPTTVSHLMYKEHGIYAGISSLNNHIKVGVRSSSLYSGDIIEYANTGDEQRDIVKNLIDKDIISELSPVDGYRLSAQHHIFLQKECGVTADKTIHVNSESFISELHDAGYRFSKDVNIDFGRYDPSYTDLVVKVLEMGKWASPHSPEPDDVSEGLKSYVRKPSDIHLKAYLLHQGVDEVAKVAKTDRQWERLIELFPQEGDRIAHLAPQKLKREIISSGLGI